MTKLHPFSFALGLVSGCVLLFLMVTAVRLVSPATGTTATSSQSGGQRQVNTARMAERLGIPESELKSEMAAGKSIRDIMAEHGVKAGSGSRMRTGSGASMSGTGSWMKHSSSGSISPSPKAS